MGYDYSNSSAAATNDQATAFDANETGPWYLAQLKPGGLARARLNLERQDFACFMPMREDSNRVRGRTVQVRQPLFPGYLFVASKAPQPCWSAVNATYGVTRLVTLDGRHPTRVPAACMAALRAACDGENWSPDATRFREIDEVRIITGPFSGIVGRIADAPKPDRIFILMEMMGQHVTTALPHGAVEAI